MMRKLLVLTCLIVFAWGLHSQEKVYMPYPEVINMHPDYQYSLARLFRTYVVQEGRYELILPPAGEGFAAPVSIEVAQTRAKEAGASFFLMSELNQISDVVIVSFTMYSTETGQKIWGDMLRALTPDDLDPILSRVAISMGTQTKASKQADIYSITGYDAMELRQQRSRYSFGITIGGSLPVGTGVDKPFGAGTGIIFSYDSRNLIFDLKGEYYWSDADIYNMSLDVIWPIESKPATPFLQGGIGIAGIDLYNATDHPASKYIWENEVSGSGLMLLMGGGYIFNRTSDVHLRLGARAFIPMFTVGDRFTPGMMINATILFGRR